MKLMTKKRMCIVASNTALNIIKRVLFWTDGTDVLYNKFDLSSSFLSSIYNCVATTTTGQWRLANCIDRNFVVCQSDHLIPGIQSRLIYRTVF